jgi:hypothetical protein
VGRTRQAVQQIGVDAGKAADQAQDASRKLATTIKLVMAAQARLREVVVAVSEVDLASNRFRLSPIKDKFKSPLDSIAAMQVEAGAEDVLKDLRADGRRRCSTPPPRTAAACWRCAPSRCRPRPPKPTRPTRSSARPCSTRSSSRWASWARCSTTPKCRPPSSARCWRRR